MSQTIKGDSKEKILYTIKKTHKAYILEFTCALVLFGIAVYGIVEDIFPANIGYILIGVAVVIVTYAEIDRFLTRYILTTEKLIIVKGIIKQHRKNIYFHPLGFIPDFNIRQGRLQRILGYGTVHIEQSSSNVFEIKDINKPHWFTEVLEELVEKSMSKSPVTSS